MPTIRAAQGHLRRHRGDRDRAGGTAVMRFWPAHAARRITVDYPLEGALFPPDFAPPTFEWRDASQSARTWTIDVSARGGTAPSVHATSPGAPPQIGDIDQDAVGPTNKPPQLHARARRAAHLETGRRHVGGDQADRDRQPGRDHDHRPQRRDGCGATVSRGQGTIQVSTDPVGAPILYRDVPLMPSAGEARRDPAARQEVRAPHRLATAQPGRAEQSRADEGPPLLHELPFGLPRRQDDGNGRGRAAEQQGPLRPVPDPARGRDPARSTSSSGARSAASWAASCAWPSCRRSRRTAATS